LIRDEAQNVKNPATRAAQVARTLRAQWRTALTGTPVENRLADLWSIFQILNPGYLGAAEEFRRRFAAPIERAGDAAAAQRLKSLCDHPTLFLHDASALPGRSGKLARLEEMLEEVLAAGDRALIFTQYAEMGRLLRAHLEATTGREVLFLHGGTPAVERDRMV